jgi:hypothetical protein
MFSPGLWNNRHLVFGVMAAGTVLGLAGMMSGHHR